MTKKLLLSLLILTLGLARGEDDGLHHHPPKPPIPPIIVLSVR